MGHIRTKIHLIFLILALSLGALVINYWNQVLQPRLYQEANSTAAIMAQAQSLRLADALSVVDGQNQVVRLTETIDEILSYTDPESDIPFFLRVEIELEPGFATTGFSIQDLQRGALDCTECLRTEIPLFDPDTFELKALAHFWVSDRYFNQLTSDFRTNTLVEAAWGLGILILVWVSVIVLFTRLQRQTTQRQRAEQALLKNQQRYDRLLNGLPGYFVYSRTPDGHFNYVSDSVQGVLGINPQRFSQQFDSLLSDPNSKALLEERLQRGVRGTQQPPFEIVLQDADGSPHHIECSETPLINHNGQVEALEGIARDVTSQQELMSELHTAKERAEQANHAKSRFLANVSHEVRTPMNAVIGMAGLALDTQLSAQQRDYLEKISTSAYSLLGMINDILDISKIEADSMQLESVDFELQEVCRHVLDIAGVKANEKNLELQIKCEPDVPSRLRGDPLRLNQVLINLVSNAIKFTDTGSVLLHAKLHSEAEDHVMLAISVQDSGIGITSDKQSKLFEPFSQADTSNTRKYGGTGLGLSICKRLVNLMQGEIQLQSTPGKGSCFQFTARFERPLLSTDTPLMPLEFDPQGGSLQYFQLPSDTSAGIDTQAKVLLVEDHPINQQLTKELLQKLGLSVQIVGDGSQALQALQQEKFAIVLMDIQMPVMDGIEATRRLRQNPRFRDLPVIALTAHSMAGDKQRYLNAGMNDYISKPMDSAQLFRLLRKWIPAEHSSTTLGHAQFYQDGLDELPELPGIDVALAVSYSSGNVELMLSLIRQFQQSYQYATQNLRQMLQQARPQDAQMLLHTIKGTASGIAAKGVVTAAQALQQVIKQQQPWQSALSEFEKQISIVLNGCTDVSKASNAKATTTLSAIVDDQGYQADEVRKLLYHLKQHLQDQNMQASVYFVQLKAQLQSIEGIQVPLNELEGLIERLDFQRAIACLQQLEREIKY